MLGEVDLAHSTGAEQPLNHVAGEDLTAVQRHDREPTGSARRRYLPGGSEILPSSQVDSAFRRLPSRLPRTTIAAAGKSKSRAEYPANKHNNPQRRAKRPNRAPPGAATTAQEKS